MVIHLSNRDDACLNGPGVWIRLNPVRLKGVASLDPSLIDLDGYFRLRPLGNHDGPPGDDMPSLSTSTSSHESWAMAQKWLKTCLADHPECASRMGSPWYPTRLLEFDSCRPYARVIETSEHRCDGPYVTLSHRWGSPEPIMLNPATGDRLHRGVSISDLPQVFREAIDICRRLGIAYLWIDCLCIVQDPHDLSDWRRESSLMHRVYNESYLNISALESRDSSHGMFNTRQGVLLQGTRITSRLEALHPGTTEREYEVADEKFWKHEVENAPLNGRGWVMQERILSNRALNFGRCQLSWECREMEASESCPDGVPRELTQRMKQSSMPEEDPEVSHTIYQSWANIVKAYSSCKLTKPADKLIALAGVAKFKWNRLPHDDYIAGMWRQNLSSDLLWAAVRDIQGIRQRCRRPLPYRAPSFSWASIDGAVIPGSIDANSQCLFEVIDVAIQSVTGDVTGLLSGGRLTIRCQLQLLQLNPWPAGTIGYTVDINGRKAREPPGGPMWQSPNPIISLDEHEDYFDPLTQEPGTLYSFPARRDRRYIWSILLKLVDAATGTYVRFGMLEFGILHGAQAPSVAHNVLESRSSEDHTFPCISFSAETRLHTISII